jgi:hypothetical protein
MSRILPRFYIFALLMALSATAFVFQAGAQKGKPVPAPSGGPVTSTIDGLGVDTTPTLRVQSDQAGSYQTIGSGRTVQLETQIGLGDWELDMLNFTSNPQRKVLIDLRDPVPGSGPNGGAPLNPFGATGHQLVRGRFIAKCSQNGLNFMTMQPNSPYFCPLALAFADANGVNYRLTQNPSHFSESNWIQVTCEATDSGGVCKQWRIEPSVTQFGGEKKNVAKLLKLSSGKNDPQLDYGDFYLSFVIHVTKP